MTDPTPRADLWPELAPVREAASRGRLTLGRCSACAKAHYYPRPLCPFCLGASAFEDAGGEGVIYSVSVSRRGPGAPSALAYVTLDEGPTVLGRIIDADLDALAIGQRVAVRLPNADPADLSPSFAPLSAPETPQ